VLDGLSERTRTVASADPLYPHPESSSSESSYGARHLPPPDSSRSIPLHPMEREGPAKRESEASRMRNVIELSPGQALKVEPNGRAAVIPNADLEAATAWRQGKIICREEPLGEVLDRLNRYSRVQIKIDDPALAERKISGIFEAGDTQGFVSIVQRYLPVIANPSESHVITLRLR